MSKRGGKDVGVDQAWDQMVERLDGVDADARELARVEQLLAAGQDAPVGADWIGRTVAEVTAAEPQTAREPARLLPIRSGWIKRVAAVLLAHWLITASVTAGTAVTVVVVLMWSSGRVSMETMPFTMAVELLQRTDQPVQDPEGGRADRRSALAQVVSWAEFGVRTLKQVEDDPREPDELRASARARLDSISDLITTPAPIARTADDSMQSSADRLRDKDLAVVERASHLEHVAHLVRVAISAVHTMPPHPLLDDRRRVYLRTLHALCRR